MLIEIVVNGEPRKVRDGLTVSELLQELSLDPARVAIELNRHIVRRPQWAETSLGAGFQLEIVQFVGGG